MSAAALFVAFALSSCAASTEETIVNESAVQVSDVLESSPHPSDALSTIENYTWEELADMSAEAASAQTDEQALEIAEKYHLVNDEGKLDGSQTKSVKLADGTEVNVMIAGFAHDNKTDGGKAGITFVFDDATRCSR